MSIKELQEALDKTGHDDALVKHFLSVWPVVESILEAFSKATKLPIFVYLRDAKIFQSSMETMPPFCGEMLRSREMSTKCVQDGLRRASMLEPEVEKGSQTQYCHAGMLNGRREIDTGSIGTLIILFGSKKSNDPVALVRRGAVINSASDYDAKLAQSLKEADELDENVGTIEKSDALLMNAISDIIQRLVGATVGFRSLTINMAHELSLMMLNMGLLAEEMEAPLAELQLPENDHVKSELLVQRNHIYHECQLGLYVVRNFLSYTSESRYAEVVRPRFKELNLEELISDMVSLHSLFAGTKNITFELADLNGLPKMRGSEMELRRLFHNVLNNAIKYSYHSLPNARRTIRIRAKVPYDPGFLKRRFSISVENYGLGVSRQEGMNVFKAGFRGEQAVAEVPIGAGIGLSEALKIMKLHAGDIKIRSRELYEGGAGNPTYLTTVELIFPYREGAE